MSEKSEKKVVVQPGQDFDPELLKCRMYPNVYPEKDEAVMVLVKKINELDMGVYVTLPEYNDADGMIMMSEVSRQRIRSINKIVRVGKLEVVVVMRVDTEKGYIDLSRRRVSLAERKREEDRYNKSKIVHSLMRHFAQIRKKKLEDLYNVYTWPLVTSGRYPHAYAAFAEAVLNPDEVWPADMPGVDREELAVLVDLIRKRMTPTPVKMRAEVDVSCFTYEGINAIKEALRAGEAVATEELPLTIKLVAPPSFVLFTSSLDKKAGLDMLQRAIDAIRTEILKRGGAFEVKEAPRAVSDHDESEFAARLSKAARDSEDYDEDEDDDDDDDDDNDDDDNDDDGNISEGSRDGLGPLPDLPPV